MASITDYLEQYEKNKKAGLGQPAGKLDLAVPTTPAQNVGSEMLPQIPMLPQGQAGVAPEGQVATPQAPSGVDPFAAQPAAVPQTPTFGLADPSSSTATGEDPFSAPIVQPATPAVADPSQLIQLKDPTSSTANQGVNNLIGFNPQYEVQSLTDFVAGRDDRSGASVQVQDPQGRFRRQAASVEGESLENNQARTNSLFPEQAAFQQASADREARQAARPDFGEAQTRAAGTVTDTERRQARGDGMSMEDATQLTEGNRDAARALLKRQELGLGEFEVQAPSQADILAREKFEASQAGAGEPTTAEKNYLLAERKYNDIVAKEAGGATLTPSEELARERFEYDKDRDTRSDQAAPAKSSTERNIETIMKANPEMSFADAANFELNLISKTTNEMTGRTEKTNLATGESTRIKSAEPQLDVVFSRKPPPEGESLWEIGSKATGAIEAGLRGAQGVVGQFGGQIASDESIQGKQKLEAAMGALTRSFREGSRYSATEDERIREELDITVGTFKDPITFQNKMRSLDETLETRMNELSDIVKSPELFDIEHRQEAFKQGNAINNFRSQMNVPPEEGAEVSAENTPPEGIEPEAAAVWAGMDEAGRALFQPKAK